MYMYIKGLVPPPLKWSLAYTYYTAAKILRVNKYNLLLFCQIFLQDFPAGGTAYYETSDGRVDITVVDGVGEIDIDSNVTVYVAFGNGTMYCSEELQGYTHEYIVHNVHVYMYVIPSTVNWLLYVTFIYTCSTTLDAEFLWWFKYLW